VEKILQAKVKPNPVPDISQKYVAAHQAFISNRAHIESALKEMMQSFSIKSEELNTGIQFLGDNITAALQLGDMEYVTNEMEWLKTLIKSHQRSAQELTDFMDNYSRAVDKHINGQGAPIKTWLKTQASREVNENGA
jgi:phage gp29-like protein